MKNKEAIEALELRVSGLESQYTELERKGNALVEVINDLRAEDGMGPRPPFGGGPGAKGKSGAASAQAIQIRPDSFYGKKLQTAAREYLEMRMLAAGGQTSPATPREIYDAITSGGYTFDSKEETALITLRQLLRKRTAFFHKLPNGTYGLTNWYEHTKKPKNTSSAQTADDDDQDDADDSNTETATTKPMAAVS